MRPRNQYAARPRRVVGRRHRRRDQTVVGGEVADGVGAGGVAGQREGLTTTSAEVDFPTVATADRGRHPLLAAESLEQWRLGPDPLQAVLAHAGARQVEAADQLLSDRARQ